jgi:hypothetical protein
MVLPGLSILVFLLIRPVPSQGCSPGPHQLPQTGCKIDLTAHEREFGGRRETQEKANVLCTWNSVFRAHCHVCLTLGTVSTDLWSTELL